MSEIEARRKDVCQALLEIETNLLEELVRMFEDMQIAEFSANLQRLKTLADLRKTVCG